MNFRYLIWLALENAALLVYALLAVLYEFRRPEKWSIFVSAAPCAAFSLGALLLSIPSITLGEALTLMLLLAVIPAAAYFGKRLARNGSNPVRAALGCTVAGGIIHRVVYLLVIAEYARWPHPLDFLLSLLFVAALAGGVMLVLKRYPEKFPAIAGETVPSL